MQQDLPEQRPGPRGPLSGIRVLDLSAYIAGPYGCSLLADQGAEVIKIEPPTGDNLRKYPSTLEAESRAFVGVNRSKWGMVLDLKQAEQLATLMRLVRDADVLVHNFRPGVPERLGIAFEQLTQINPRLVYCSVTGYGATGPLRAKAATLSAEKAARILADLGWPGERISAVAHAVATHSFSAGLTPETLEAKILQDSDRLDAIGMVGVARCFYVGGRMGSALYDFTNPSAAGRDYQDRQFSLEHFHTKLDRKSTRLNSSHT